MPCINCQSTSICENKCCDVESLEVLHEYIDRYKQLSSVQVFTLQEVAELKKLDRILKQAAVMTSIEKWAPHGALFSFFTCENTERVS